jgi:hypothetical protein
MFLSLVMTCMRSCGSSLRYCLAVVALDCIFYFFKGSYVTYKVK